MTKKIRERCDVIIQYSTGGAVGNSIEERCAPLRLRPEMASISMGTMNFGEDIFENSENTIRIILDAIIMNGVMAELEIFDCGMMETVDRSIKKGCLPDKFHIDFVLGVRGGMSGRIKNLVLLSEYLSPGQSWSVAGIGKYQLPLAGHAILMGGHVRIGIEDNIYYRKGELTRSNKQLVERVVRISKEMDRPIATVRDARDILDL